MGDGYGGICQKCGKRDERTLIGYYHCAKCAKLDHEKYLRQRAKRTQEQKIAASLALLRRREDWVSQHLCSHCGGKLEDDKHKTCEYCRKKSKLRYETRKAKKNES